jgi:uncharacterized membrane protein (Fun14 family)
MSEIVSPIIYQLGIGGIGGFIVGYVVKKLSKLIAFLIGLFIIALVYLGVQGIISINYGGLWEKLEGIVGSAGQSLSWLIGIISIIPFMGSFVVGFLVGFKIG